MNQLKKKYGLIRNAIIIALVLLVVRIIIDALQLDLITVNTIIGSFVGAAIFTIAIILAGTLTDFKESERIPGELASAIRNLYQDSRLVQLEDPQIVHGFQDHVRELLGVINTNFRNNKWKMNEIHAAMDNINDDIAHLAEKNVPPQFLVKLRNEVSAVDRISGRVEIIMQTSFIPSAYAIAELATAGVIFILMIIKLDPYYEGLIVFSVITTLMIALILLIRDIDNPFEVGKESYAEVDLKLLWSLEEYLNNKK